VKKIYVLVSLLLIAGLLLAGTGCVSTTDNDSETGNSININPSFYREGTLQGKIMDAVTGDAIGGDDLLVYLIKGKDNVKPDKLIKDTEDIFIGEYAFTSIPVGIADDELEFKLVVIKSGYQQFESIVCLTATLIEGYSWENDQIDNTFTNEMFNMIGNIYLYPLGSSPKDITIKVRDPQGTPIDGAIVLLQQNVTANLTVADTGNRLTAAPGMYKSLGPIETDPNGEAVFSGANLVLGGAYNVVVKPLDFNGQELQATYSSVFFAGVDTPTQIVNMNVVAGSDTLVATSASNQLPGTITPDGSLIITFNQPILVNKLLFMVSETGDGVLSSTAAMAELSSGNRTLTLRVAGWTTPPTSAGASVTYTYTGGEIILKNSQTSSGSTLSGAWTDVINSQTGEDVDRTVLMISN
jgi:hypothetical protein